MEYGTEPQEPEETEDPSPWADVWYNTRQGCDYDYGDWEDEESEDPYAHLRGYFDRDTGQWHPDPEDEDDDSDCMDPDRRIFLLESMLYGAR